MSQPPLFLIFDSGLGGLTVYEEVRLARPDASMVYLADDAAFPYGALGEGILIARVSAVIGAAIAMCAPEIVIIACHTASTLVLPHLRAEHPAIAFVGTVPAIKPAALLSRSRMFSVLATRGTVKRDYTQDLIREFASDCEVNLVGAEVLARLAERELRGDPAPDSAIRAEIEPAFVTREAARTDTVVLACTHFPLLLPRLERLAPWPVNWVNPAPAIARRLVQLAGASPPNAVPAPPAAILFTSGNLPDAALAVGLVRRGLAPGAPVAIPFDAKGTIDSGDRLAVPPISSRGRKAPRRH